VQRVRRRRPARGRAVPPQRTHLRHGRAVLSHLQAFKLAVLEQQAPGTGSRPEEAALP
jgi:hypothetical protein